ncbi:MAG: hypothetical protein IT480_03220 [Gammaproteobacteria bacterium]|nr:hypothetical protein [Gammaproteobacteria bacterium]
MRNLTDRLESAVVYLAGSGTIKERLVEAYDKCLADLTAEDFPGELRADFSELMRALHRERALPGESLVRASVRKLSLEDARRYTTLIVRTYGTLAGTRNEAASALRLSSPLVRLLAADATPLARSSAVNPS